MNILFVCTGNTCRSPLAVAAWQACQREAESTQASSGEATAAKENANGGVESAGLAANVGASANRNSISVAREWGIDLSSHRARQLNQKMVSGADLICTMTEDAAWGIRQHFGSAKNVCTLGEFAARAEAAGDTASDAGRLRNLLDESEEDEPSAHDILDPFGASLEVYQACGEQIRRAVRVLFREVQNGTVQL